MVNDYFCPKMKYAKDEVEFLYLFFENGDFLEIEGAEVVDFSINVYDKLIRSYQGYNPVVESGYLKLAISDKPALIKSEYFLYNEAVFKKDRKSYIENRCIEESRITEIWLFDSNNWHKVLHCELQAKMDGDCLVFEFLPQPRMGDYRSENHCVSIKNLRKEDIRNIDLDFENCESFVVYNSEIEEVNINFDNRLEWGAGDLYRKAVGGYIKIKLDKYFAPRQNHLFDNEKGLKVVDFERRLCGKKGEDTHDICHLYVEYCPGCKGVLAEECIEVDGLFLDTEEAVFDDVEGQIYVNYDCYDAGYCKKTKDGSLIISFGKNAKNTIQKLCNGD